MLLTLMRSISKPKWKCQFTKTENEAVNDRGKPTEDRKQTITVSILLTLEKCDQS